MWSDLQHQVYIGCVIGFAAISFLSVLSSFILVCISRCRSSASSTSAPLYASSSSNYAPLPSTPPLPPAHNLDHPHKSDPHNPDPSTQKARSFYDFSHSTHVDTDYAHNPSHPNASSAEDTSPWQQSGRKSIASSSISSSNPGDKPQKSSQFISGILLLILVGDLTYSGAALIGGVSQQIVDASLDPAQCVFWGSVIVLGYTIVFFALPAFFVIYYLQCAYPNWLPTSRSSGNSKITSPLIQRSNRSSSSLSSSSTISSNSSLAPSSSPSRHRKALSPTFALSAILITVVGLSVGFQIMWNFTYMHVYETMTECGVENCSNKIHIHRAESSGMYLVYLLPFLLCCLICPIFAYLTVRTIRKQLKNSGSYTEAERKHERELRYLLLLYLTGFFLFYWPNLLEFIFSFFLPKFCEPGSISDIFWLNLLQVILNPLHGVWNSAIFVWRRHLPKFGNSST